MGRFDWYQASVSAEPAAVRERLAVLGDAWERSERVPHGYGYGERLVDADGLVAQLWWGGTHECPHAVISGERAPAGAELLREAFPGHRVTRADVCTDYAQPGAYDRLQELAIEVARDRRVAVGTAGDHLLTREGRTCYLGSTASATRMRLYDKAAELRAKFAGRLDVLGSIPEHLARMEFQVRPQSPAAKLAASRAEPVALIGAARWSRDLYERVEGVKLEPFQAERPWRQPDDARSYAALLVQFGPLLGRMVEDHGSWAALGEQIGYDLAERARLRRRG